MFEKFKLFCLNIYKKVCFQLSLVELRAQFLGNMSRMSNLECVGVSGFKRKCCFYEVFEFEISGDFVVFHEWEDG